MASEDDEFALLFDELYPSLCRFLECMLAGRGVVGATAQDLAQESFLQLYRQGLEGFAGGDARFWLFRVARNFALNELNKGHTRTRLLGTVVEVLRGGRQPNPEQELEMAERREIVFEMLKTLPEHQRSALVLREQEEMSYRETAHVLGISESKVKVDVFRARRALREKWGRTQNRLAKSAG